MAENKQQNHLENNSVLVESKILLAQSWLTFKAQYPALLKISLLAFIPAVIGELGGRLLELWLPGLSNVDLAAITVVINLILLFFGLWTTAALIMFVSHQLPYSKELFKQSLKKFWPLFLMTLLSVLIVGLGFILLIIPGLILLVLLHFSSYFIVLENQKPVQSLQSSRELTRGNFWPIVKILLWLAIVNLGVMILWIAVFSALAWLLGRTDEFSQPLASLISSWLLAPFNIIYLVRLFNNLKEIKK